MSNEAGAVWRWNASPRRCKGRRTSAREFGGAGYTAGNGAAKLCDARGGHSVEFCISGLVGEPRSRGASSSGDGASEALEPRCSLKNPIRDFRLTGELPMPQGPVQGPGTTPGGGQSGRPGVAGGTSGQKSSEQSAPDRA